MASEVKLCKDCKHFRPRLNYSFYVDECHRNTKLVVDQIRGKKYFEGELNCASERNPLVVIGINFNKDVCGPEGKYFVHRPSLWERIKSCLSKNS